MTGRKKGVSIGAAMKQRMGTQESTLSSEQKVEDVEVPPRVKPVIKEVATPAVITVEDDPLESFNTRLPRSLQRRLKVYVALNNSKIQDVLNEALSEYLDRKER